MTGGEPARPSPMSDASTTRKLGFAAALLVGTVLASRLLGFLREMFIAAFFGANGATDAFIAAFTIPDTLNYLVAGGTLSITFIPIYSRHLAEGNSAEGDRVFSIIVTVMTLVLTAAVLVLELYTPELSAAYLRKLKPDDLALAVRLTRILLPAQIGFYLGGIASATLMARHRFVAVAAAPLLYNLGTIVGGVVLGRWLGVASLAWGSLAGALVGPLAVQAVAAWRAGLRYRPTLAVRHPEFRHWLLASLPLMIGVQLITVDEWIVRYFAAGDVGAISCINYARKLVMVPIAVAGQAVGQASMPFFARLWAEGKRSELVSMMVRSARASATVAALAAGALAALAVPTVDLLFRRGRFGAEQVLPTAHYVAIFALAIPLWGMQGIVARAFYATRDTLTPMLAGTAVTLASLPIYWLGFHSGGVTGLVVASDLGIALHTASLLVLLPRRLGDSQRGALLGGALRAYLLAALAGGPAWLVARLVPAGHLGDHALALVRVLVGGIVFVTVAAALAGPLGAEDAAALFTRVTARLRRLARR